MYIHMNLWVKFTVTLPFLAWTACKHHLLFSVVPFWLAELLKVYLVFWEQCLAFFCRRVSLLKKSVGTAWRLLSNFESAVSPRWWKRNSFHLCPSCWSTEGLQKGHLESWIERLQHQSSSSSSSSSETATVIGCWPWQTSLESALVGVACEVYWEDRVATFLVFLVADLITKIIMFTVCKFQGISKDFKGFLRNFKRF